MKLRATYVAAALLLYAPAAAADDPAITAIGHWKLRCWRGQEAQASGFETCRAINAGVGSALLSRTPQGIGLMFLRTPCSSVPSKRSVSLAFDAQAVDRAPKVNAAIRGEFVKVMVGCAKPWPIVLLDADMARLLAATDNLKKLR